MKNVLHFESGREYQFNSCPCCHEHTKKKRLHYEDILQTSENKKGDTNEESFVYFRIRNRRTSG